jgi:hypothetical protein
VKSKSDKGKIYLIKTVPGCDSRDCEIPFVAENKEIRDQWFNLITENL